jgi:hypothetical protein
VDPLFGVKSLLVRTMSGLEVVAIVAAIVSAFHASVEILSKIKQRQASQRDKLAHDSAGLELSLSRGGSDVQQEYNLDFARIGPSFAKGDGIVIHVYLFVSTLIPAARHRKSHSKCCRHSIAGVNHIYNAISAYQHYSSLSV